MSAFVELSYPENESKNSYTSVPRNFNLLKELSYSYNKFSELVIIPFMEFCFDLYSYKNLIFFNSSL